MNKRIKNISIVAFTLGLIVQLSAIFVFTPYRWLINSLDYLKVASPNLNLQYIVNRLLTYNNHTTDLSINFLDLAVYLLLFIGFLIYAKSKGKEIRLLRFTFSIIMLSSIIAIVYYILSPFFFKNPFQGDSIKILKWVLSFISKGVWLYLSYIVVNELSKKRKVAIKTNSDGDETFIDTPKSQRFAHHIIDLILSIVICSKFVILTSMSLLESIEDLFGERFAMYFVIVLSRLLYFVFFETLFNASPAKFLTESRLIANDNTKINVKTTFLRTLSRHVPFEGFSYLGEGNGWHDKWVKTSVVKESGSNVSTGKYLLIVLGFLIIGGASYFGHLVYERYERNIYQKEKHIEKIEEIKNELAFLSTSHVFLIKPNKEYARTEDYFYIKVEEVIETDIVFSVFQVDTYSPKNYEIERVYNSKKSKLQTVILTKEILLQSLTFDYEQYKNGKRNGVDFLGTEQKYEVDNVFQIFGPAIKKGSVGYGRGELHVRFENDGWGCELIEIQNIQGDLEWKEELPKKIKPVGDYIVNSFSLGADNYKKGTWYEFTLVFQDSLNNNYKYWMKGINGERDFKKVRN